MQQQLLIIYTGGTIGMIPSEQGYTPGAGMQKLIEDCLGKKLLQQLQPFHCIEFKHLIDSSNAQPKDWLQIAQCISDNYQKYAGFIILHGTDTMAYTAAALGHMLGRNTKPVIITGSQIPMCQPRSDAFSNLIDAAFFARSSKVSQVCLYFAGKLLPADSVTKVHSSKLAAFDTPNGQPLATANICLNFTAEQHTNTQTDNNQKIHSQFRLQPLTENSVAVLLLYPGISNPIIAAALLDKTIKAVVMLSFGAGNLADQNKYLMDSLKEARSRGTVIINMTQCYAGAVAQGTYAVGSSLNKLGVISAAARTLEDVVTDLYINLDKYL
ncbi:MAG: asparaginase [Pseudomonadales bacterium]|nr:asparaginase [Pseudomonadales bacterium]NRA15294.1 asparaginase [Oceanospirillaceae bacterium]